MLQLDMGRTWIGKRFSYDANRSCPLTGTAPTTSAVQTLTAKVTLVDQDRITVNSSWLTQLSRRGETVSP